MCTRDWRLHQAEIDPFENRLSIFPNLIMRREAGPAGTAEFAHRVALFRMTPRACEAVGEVVEMVFPLNSKHALP